MSAPRAASTCRSPALPRPPACDAPRGRVASASFSPDGRTVVVSVVSETPKPTETVEVWDPRAGKPLRTLVSGLEPHGRVQMEWTADGSRLAAAGVGDSRFGFRIFDTATWKALHEDEKSHWSFPCALAIDPAGTRVAMTTLIGAAEVRDLKTGKAAGSIWPDPLRAAGHVCSFLQWSGDGKALQLEGQRAAAGLAPMRRKPVRDDDLVHASFAPKGDMVAYLDDRGNVRLFSGNGRVPFKVLAAGKDVTAPPHESSPPVRWVSWRPDATALATWDHGGKIRVWDAIKGTLVRELRGVTSELASPPDHEVEEARLVWAPDGRSFAFWDGSRAELWSLDDGKQKLADKDAGKPEYQHIANLRFSPDGALLAAGDALWDTKTGALVRKLPAQSAAWLDGGRFLLLAPGRDSRALRVMRASDGAVLAIERLGEGASATLLAYTEQWVFQGAPEHAGCARDTWPEPRDTLLADFWAGRPVARTCPLP